MIKEGIVKKMVVLPFFVIITVLLTIAVAANGELVLSKFESEDALLSWNAGDFVASVTTSQYTEIEQGSFLTASGAVADTQYAKTIFATPKTKLDLSSYRYIKARIKVDDFKAGSVNCYAKMMVTNQNGESRESIKRILSGTWQELIFELSSLKDRKDISQISIDVVPENIASDTWSEGFAIDDVVAYGYVDPIMAERFLIGEYTAYSADVEFSDDLSCLGINPINETEDFSFEFVVDGEVKKHTNALRVNIENTRNCSDFSVFFYDDSGQRVGEPYREYGTSAPFETLYLDLPNPEQIKIVKFTFPAAVGQIRINSMEFTDIYESSSEITYGNINSCIYDIENKILEIRGNIDKEKLSKFNGSQITLYALDLYEDFEIYNYTEADVLASCSASENYSFSLDIPTLGSEYLAKQYIVMSDNELISPPVCVQVSFNNMSDSLIYGATYIDSYVIADSCIGATVIDVYLDRLLLSDADSEPYLYENNNYYFNTEYAEEIEKNVKDLAYSNIKVSLRLVISSNEFDYLVYSSKDEKIDNYIPNISNELGYQGFKAAVNYLMNLCAVQENTEYGVDSLIIGKQINSGNTVAYAPSMPKTEFVKMYANLLRLAYFSADNPDICVYASVDSTLEHAILNSEGNHYDASAFLSALNQYIEDTGTFPWGVCVDMTDSEENGDKLLSLDDADSISEVLKASDAIIIINHLEADAGDTEEFVTSAVSSLMQKALTDFDGRYILDLNKCDERLKAKILEYIKAFLSNDTGMLSYSGIDTKLYDSFKSAVLNAFCEYSSIQGYFESTAEFSGKYKYFDFETASKLEGWHSVYNESKLGVVTSENGARVLACSFVSPHFENAPSAIVFSSGKTFSFDYTPVLSADITVTDHSGEKNGSKAAVTVRFTGEGIIHDVTADVIIGQECTVYANMSSLRKQPFDSVMFLMACEDDIRFDMSIDNICGYSEKYESQELEKLILEAKMPTSPQGFLNFTVIAVFVVLITALSTLTIILYLKRRATDKH